MPRFGAGGGLGAAMLERRDGAADADPDADGAAAVTLASVREQLHRHTATLTSAAIPENLLTL
ncbi:MAG TPA: hypothetical protein VJN18_31520 [Polyangiaceae bacterium]|nr:hypothetical protein [Polyangiaceae bacterium]